MNEYPTKDIHFSIMILIECECECESKGKITTQQNECNQAQEMNSSTDIGINVMENKFFSYPRRNEKEKNQEIEQS